MLMIRPEALAHHRADHRAATVEDRVEIGGDHVVPGLGRHRRQQVVAVRAGIVDQHVDPVVGSENVGDGALPGGALGDVEIDQAAAAGEFLREFPGGGTV